LQQGHYPELREVLQQLRHLFTGFCRQHQVPPANMEAVHKCVEAAVSASSQLLALLRFRRQVECIVGQQQGCKPMQCRAIECVACWCC
jgi:hypothetical protein